MIILYENIYSFYVQFVLTNEFFCDIIIQKRNEGQIMKRITNIFLIVILLCACIVSCSKSSIDTGNNDSSTNEANITYLPIYLDEYYNEYMSNAVRAKNTYLEKYVELCGNVTYISEEYINIKSYFNGTAKCLLSDKISKDLILSLNEDDYIRVYGKFLNTSGLELQIDTTKIESPEQFLYKDSISFSMDIDDVRNIETNQVLAFDNTNGTLSYMVDNYYTDEFDNHPDSLRYTFRINRLSRISLSYSNKSHEFYSTLLDKISKKYGHLTNQDDYENLTLKSYFKSDSVLIIVYYDKNSNYAGITYMNPAYNKLQ